MNGITLVLLIVMALIGFIILWKILKPYFLKYDTTLCIVGGLGSGKSLTSVKTAVVLLRKQRIKVAFINLRRRIGNYFKRKITARHVKYNLKHFKLKNPRTRGIKKGKKLYLLKPRLLKPQLYSNIPVHYRKHLWFWSKREWNITLEASHLLLLKEIIEYSVVMIDELPQFINQFNWNNELIKTNVNECITFFRHYVGGYFITNAQAIDDVVLQIRRKLNQATWCFDFHKYGWPIPLFYTIRMCDIQLSDQVQTISTTFIQENTKLHFGLFPPRKTYDTRCYSERYKNVFKRHVNEPRYKNLKTNVVLRLQKYESPLDDIRTEDEKQRQWEKGEKIWKN